MASPSDLPIVLYHYDVSPYARRLVWYLHLRKIKYSQCIQPRILPRPDLALLGVSYRRIPILSIGRDVYLDTRLILQKLEALYPPSAAHPGLSSPKAEHAALEQLLSTRVIEGDLFKRAVECFPVNAFADPAFLRDRAALYGVDAAKAEAEAAGTALPLAPEAMRRRRPEALAVVGRWVRWLEEGLLADGRGWILDSASDESGSGNGGAVPSLADIEAVWVLHWLHRVPGALPLEVLGADATPRVWAWIKRFDSAVKDAARSAAAAVSSLKGEEAARLIAGSAFADREGEVRRADPLVDARGLAKGASVRVWPTDYGSSHKDAGRLVAVDDTEFVIEAEGTFGSVRIHAPREGFTIARDGGSSVASKI